MRDTSLEFKNMNGKYNYVGSAAYAYYSALGYCNIDNFYAIDPLSEVSLYLYASIPDEIADNFSGGTVNWTFRDGTTYSLNFQ